MGCRLQSNGYNFNVMRKPHTSFTLWCVQFQVMVYEFHVMRKPTTCVVLRIR